MAPMNSTNAPTAAEFDVIQNRLAVAFAQRERLIKSWTASSSRPRPPPKTQEQLDAEDAELFHLEPPHLGLGAPIPKEYLEGDVKRKEISSNEKLRHLILGKKTGLQGSKPRDAQEKAVSAKRGLKEYSSDEEEGRSSLGKAKKVKLESPAAASAHEKTSKEVVKKRFSSSISPLPAVKIKTENGVQPDTKPKMKKIEIQGPSAPQKHTDNKVKVNGISKKPLVDYTSEDELSVDQPEKKPNQHVNKASVTTSNIVDKETEASKKNDSMLKASTPPLNKPSSSVSSSKHSSTASVSDSEPSDLEAEIPKGLTSDVIPRTTMTNPNLPKSPEQKREKNRLKKAKRRERKLRERELALASANAAAGKSGASSNGGKVKLKDQLLDANGN